METAPSLTRSFGSADSAAGTAESSVSAVSWPAVLAGAFVASAITLILVILGSGLGVSATSLHGNIGAEATTLTVATVVWLVIVQWVASGVGGYITGRLRTKWVGTHTHEVFFRDTAHGLLTWAVAAVALVTVLASITSSTLKAGASVASAAASSASGTQTSAGDLQNYEIDRLLRQDRPPAASTPAEVHAEIARILAVDLANGSVTQGDRDYLTQLVAANDGISPADAQQRVDSLISQVNADKAQAQQDLSKAKKAAASLAIITALSMIIGAFTASIAAALGGGRRDEHL